MTFARPVFLYALILVPLLGLFMLWASHRRTADLARLGDLTLLRRLSETVNWRGRRWRNGLWLAVFALGILALARPQWGSVTEIALLISGECDVATQPSTWGKIKSLYTD